MFEIRQLVTPVTLDEAYQILIANRNNRLLGGCAFLKMGSKLINQGIDLNALKLNQITHEAGCLTLGATCTYGDLTNHPLLLDYAGGLIPRALQPIVGVQLRNAVEVGASVFSRYGFSDLIPALLAVDAEITLHHAGKMTLHSFLELPLTRDILVAVHLPDRSYRAACQSLRVTASDLPIVNCAVSFDIHEKTWRIAVGARPSRAKRALAAETLLNSISAANAGPMCLVTLLQAADLVASDLTFGSNQRASAAYRRAMAKVLVERALREVALC
ncbi:MAG: FAD binding domain-containing protein [Eubacteriales bacterium]|nr:FAD binding domain-containing protein [Eubacteriales bacterium]